MFYSRFSDCFLGYRKLDVRIAGVMHPSVCRTAVDGSRFGVMTEAGGYVCGPCAVFGRGPQKSVSLRGQVAAEANQVHWSVLFLLNRCKQEGCHPAFIPAILPAVFSGSLRNRTEIINRLQKPKDWGYHFPCFKDKPLQRKGWECTDSILERSELRWHPERGKKKKRCLLGMLSVQLSF